MPNRVDFAIRVSRRRCTVARRAFTSRPTLPIFTLLQAAGTVPEPDSIFVVGIGALAMLNARRRGTPPSPGR